MTAVGMLSYLQIYAQIDISIAVNQCARFFNNSRLFHERSVRHIENYLARTSTYTDLPNRHRRISKIRPSMQLQ